MEIKPVSRLVKLFTEQKFLIRYDCYYFVHCFASIQNMHIILYSYITVSKSEVNLVATQFNSIMLRFIPTFDALRMATQIGDRSKFKRVLSVNAGDVVMFSSTNWIFENVVSVVRN